MVAAEVARVALIAKMKISWMRKRKLVTRTVMVVVKIMLVLPIVFAQSQWQQQPCIMLDHCCGWY